MIVTVVNHNGSKFSAANVASGVLNAERVAIPGDTWRIYVVDDRNPYPGYVAAVVNYERGKGVVTDAWAK